MPRTASKLTPKAIRDLKPRAKKYDTRDGTVPGLMVVTAPTGRKVWMLEYLRNGKRTRIGFQRLADAKAWTITRVKKEQEKAWAQALELRNKLTDKSFDPRAKPDPVPTLRHYLTDHYGPWVKVNRTDGAATLARIESCFLEPFGDLPIDQITADLADGWRTDRKDSGIQPSTLNRDTGALRACLSHKGRRAFKKVKQWCPVHPFDDLDPLEVVTENPRFLDRDKGEDTRLFRALEDREQKLRQERISANEWRKVRGYKPMLEFGAFADYLRPMVIVLLHTGMRIGELSKLKWGAVDFPNERVTVMASTSKTKKPRTVPLNSVALQTLKDWRSQTKGLGLVFSHEDGTSIGSIRKAFGRVLETAKIENFTLHHLRHSFASWLVQDDEPIFNVSRLLGHANVATTQIYTHLAPDHSRDAVERLAGNSGARR